MAKIFATGTTGYIGGDALYLISQKHPEWELTCLVRNSDKGAKVAAVYPKVRLVYGDLDTVDLIEEEAANSDIVYHFANCDHEASARAIAKGLARRNREGTGYWIHTSGTLILGWETIDLADFGNRLDKVYDDWDNVGELISQPDHAAHRNDLSNLYLLLGEAALNGGSPATWNDQGYYLAENGPFVWGDLIQEIANVAHKNGLLPEATVESLSPAEAETFLPNARLLMGTNSRGVSIRGKKLLGWKPAMHGIMEEIPECVESEAERLGLIKRHAAKVAG
ncbi:hypothetical protein AYO21_01253 [Fonsecaea monophora]|uniref:NAD-dependent epimerase/dehydratase domain-containing protein n=1 Tax=Fonsecaea monophora TaxID=254056 RepID=A0A177FJ97_9EURO|nr:hypothetical protein AYO21_01253 [Fonsecaea monophora]OAG44257.1 hypothetical protein AYO21_01253 [Fonsecaea monophora]